MRLFWIFKQAEKVLKSKEKPPKSKDLGGFSGAADQI